jgi:putative FmdB family regulatory protein
MPTYEYVCAKCGHEFEKVQPIADKALKVCPQDVCVQKKWGRGAVKRKISTGGGLIFKGSGFYTTDYRSEGYKQAAKKESDAAKPASGDTKSAGGGESKPAKTSETKAAKPESKAAKSSPEKT